jgi:hypothetical protein
MGLPWGKSDFSKSPIFPGFFATAQPPHVAPYCKKWLPECLLAPGGKSLFLTSSSLPAIGTTSSARLRSFGLILTPPGTDCQPCKKRIFHPGIVAFSLLLPAWASVVAFHGPIVPPPTLAENLAATGTRAQPGSQVSTF